MSPRNIQFIILVVCVLITVPRLFSAIRRGERYNIIKEIAQFAIFILSAGFIYLYFFQGQQPTPNAIIIIMIGYMTSLSAWTFATFKHRNQSSNS